MRSASLACLLLLVAGCADPAEPTDAATPQPAAVEELVIPDPLHFSGALVAVAEPATSSTTGCGPQNIGCAAHAFAIEDRLGATLRLVSVQGTVTGAGGQVLWGTDYDLFLFDGSGELVASSTEPSGTDDVLELVLPAGSYRADVMAWHDQDGEYTLDIAFAAPTAT